MRRPARVESQQSGRPDAHAAATGPHALAAPARALYESFGFVPAEHLPNGPEGGSRQRFRLQLR